MSDQSEHPVEEPQYKPIEVSLPTRRPVMTYILIAVTVIIFILQYLSEAKYGVDIPFIYGVKVNALILEGELWRLVTPAFLHSSILHIAFNMYALFVVGRRLERFYGHGRFLLLYLLCAFAGNAFSFVLTRANSLGASTAVFGLFTAEGMFIFQNRKLFGSERTRKMIINLGIILAMNLVYGFISMSSVDNMGHIGGLLGGIFFAWRGGPVLKITGTPPLFQVKDKRKILEILFAGLMVILGFGIIIAIPFFLLNA
jgi:rhomboid protease GluP